MTKREELLSLAEALTRASGKGRMRFSVCKAEPHFRSGWITTNSEEAVRILCDIWNNRELIASARALRAHASMVTV